MFEIKTTFVQLAAVIGVGVCSMRTLAFAPVPDGFVGVWRGGKSGLADESYLVIRDGFAARSGQTRSWGFGIMLA